MNVISTAASQYYSRPDDERFPSLEAMIGAAREDQRLSRERVYTLADLAVGTDGPDVNLISPRGTAAFSHWAFGQFARTVGAPAGYLRELSPDLAAACLNYGIDHAPAGQQINLLARGANGHPPTVRAATSETYGRVWDADLYGEIARRFDTAGTPINAGHTDGWGLPPTWDGRPAGAYRGDRDSFLILVNGGSIVGDPSGGQGNDGAIYRGILVRNSEVGASSVVIDLVGYRYICGNHNLWGAFYDRKYRRRHVGRAVVRDTVREILTVARLYANTPASRDEHLIRRLLELEIAHTRDGVISELRAMGATAQQAAAAYDACETSERIASPRSYWGLTQGITRISQQGGFQDDRYQLDRLGAQLIARGRKVAA